MMYRCMLDLLFIDVEADDEAEAQEIAKEKLIEKLLSKTDEDIEPFIAWEKGE